MAEIKKEGFVEDCAANAFCRGIRRSGTFFKACQHKAPRSMEKGS